MLESCLLTTCVLSAFLIPAYLSVNCGKKKKVEHAKSDEPKSQAKRGTVEDEPLFNMGAPIQANIEAPKTRGPTIIEDKEPAPAPKKQQVPVRHKSSSYAAKMEDENVVQVRRRSSDYHFKA